MAIPFKYVLSDITEDDLNTALPYENTFDVGQIEGSKLKELFEYNTMFDRDGEIHLRLLQVSGMSNIFTKVELKSSYEFMEK